MVIQGVLLSLLAAVSTAVSHTMAKWCRNAFSLEKFLWVRTTAAFITLLGISILSKDFFHLYEVEFYYLFMVAVSGLISPLLVGFAAFWALERTPVSIRMPVFASYPFFVFILSIIFLEENLTIFTGLGAVIIFVGVVGLVLGKSNTKGVDNIKYRNRHLLPIIATCAGSLLMAINVILWKIFSSYWGFSALNINLLQTFVAVVVLTALNVRKPMTRNLTPNVIFATAISGFLVFGVANILSITAMRYIPSPAVYSIVCSNILLIGIFARVWFKEKWSSIQFASALAICAGIVILTLF